MHRLRARFARTVLFSAAALALPAGSVFAQATPPEASPGQPQPLAQAAKPEPANTLNIHGSVNLTYTTDYITRGVLLENQGAIFQPSAELDFTLLDNPDAPSFGKVTAIVGIWNSIHSHHEFAASDSLKSWYEFDWYAGVGVNVTPELSATLLYQEFLSPSDAFGTCKNVQLKLAYNDSKMWKNVGPWDGFALNPYGLVFWEVDGKAGTGSDEGIYVELGIGPSYTFGGDSALPVTLTVPLTVGLGFSDFYGSGQTAAGAFTGEDDETFGFASVGVVASLPLKFLSDRGYGAWTYSIGGYYYYLGDGVQDFNDSFAGGDSSSEWVATTGLSLAF